MVLGWEVAETERDDILVHVHVNNLSLVVVPQPTRPAGTLASTRQLLVDACMCVCVCFLMWSAVERCGLVAAGKGGRDEVLHQHRVQDVSSATCFERRQDRHPWVATEEFRSQ